MRIKLKERKTKLMIRYPTRRHNKTNEKPHLTLKTKVLSFNVDMTVWTISLSIEYRGGGGQGRPGVTDIGGGCCVCLATAECRARVAYILCMFRIQTYTIQGQMDSDLNL